MESVLKARKSVDLALMRGACLMDLICRKTVLSPRFGLIKSKEVKLEERDKFLTFKTIQMTSTTQNNCII
jgi:hypothetical protein